MLTSESALWASTSGRTGKNPEKKATHLPILLRCEICSFGSYSITANSAECDPCFNNAVCEGGNNVRVLRGYWRSSNQSISVLKCLNEDACEGGFGNEGDGASPCAKGYGGNLCDACVTDEEGSNYERITQHTCSKCPDKLVNAVRIAAMTVIIMLCVACLIW